MPNASNIEIAQFDINWENLDNTSVDILVEKGPTREMNLNFPNDKYLRKLRDEEISDRKRLISCQPS